MSAQMISFSADVSETILLADLVPSETEHVELIVEEGAHIVCIDTRVSTLPSGTLGITISLHDNAQLVYCDQRRFDGEAHIKNMITFSVARDSKMMFEQWHISGKKVHTTIDVQLIGCNAEVSLRLGASLHANQRQEVTTIQHHQAAHTKSHCHFKTIVAGNASSRYEGMITVASDAINTEAFLDHRAIVMGDTAYAYARPSLEVHTDEVQCGHGSAIGQLDAEHLFYLQARGIEPTLAQELLQRAFIDELYESEIMQQYVGDQIRD